MMLFDSRIFEVSTGSSLQLDSGLNVDAPKGHPNRYARARVFRSPAVTCVAAPVGLRKAYRTSRLSPITAMIPSPSRSAVPGSGAESEPELSPRI